MSGMKCNKYLTRIPQVDGPGVNRDQRDFWLFALLSLECWWYLFSLFMDTKWLQQPRRLLVWQQLAPVRGCRTSLGFFLLAFSGIFYMPELGCMPSLPCSLEKENKMTVIGWKKLSFFFPWFGGEPCSEPTKSNPNSWRQLQAPSQMGTG